MQCEELFLALHFYGILITYEQNSTRMVLWQFSNFYLYWHWQFRWRCSCGIISINCRTSFRKVSLAAGDPEDRSSRQEQRDLQGRRDLQGLADLIDRRDLQEPADLTGWRELQDPVNLTGRRELQEPVNLTGRRDRKDLIQRKLLQGRCKSLRANGSGARHAKKIENFETGRPENEQRLLYIL